MVGAGTRPSYPQCVKGQRHAFSIGVTEPPAQQKLAGLVSRRWWKGVQLGIHRSVCASLGRRQKGGRRGCFAPTGTSVGILDFPSMVLVRRATKLWRQKNGWCRPTMVLPVGRGSAVIPRRVTTVAPRLLATATEPAATHSFYRIAPWCGLHARTPHDPPTGGVSEHQNFRPAHLSTPVGKNYRMMLTDNLQSAGFYLSATHTSHFPLLAEPATSHTSNSVWACGTPAC